MSIWGSGLRDRIEALFGPTIVQEYGNALPLVLGRARVPGQVIYAGPSLGKKDMIIWNGVGYQGGTWMIRDVVYAICEAPITDVRRVFRPGLSIGGTYPTHAGSLYWYDGANTPQIILSDSGVATWGRYTGAQAGMAHQGTAHIRYPNCFCNSDGTPFEMEFEVDGYGSGANGESDTGDAHFADLVVYLLTHIKNGLGLSSSLVDVENGMSGGPNDSYRRYCSARGWYGSRAIEKRESVTDTLDQIMRITDSELIHVGGKMKPVPYCDKVITRSTFTFTPNTTPIVIDAAEMIHEKEDPPTEGERRQEAEIFGVWPVSYIVRDPGDHGSVLYKSVVREYVDPVWTGQYGARRAEVEAYEWVMSQAHAGWLTHARAQRAIYQRNRLTFKLGQRWNLLTPMDYLSVSDPLAEIVNLTVRIVSIDEEESGELKIEAVEWPSNTAEPIDLTPQLAEGLQADWLAFPPPAPTDITETLLRLGGGNLFKNARLYDASGGWYAPWEIYNNSSGSEPSTITAYATGGPDGGSYERHAWSGTNTTTKGFFYNGNPTVAEMLRHDTDYVFSWYARAGAAQSFGMEPRWNYNPDDQVALLNPNLQAMTPGEPTSGWQRYAYRIRWNAGSTIDPDAFLTIINGSAMTGYVEIACAQLEEGLQPTGWQRSGDETQATANSKVKTFAQATTPTASAVGDLWIDTDDNNRLYRCTGLPSTWVDVRDGTIVTAQQTADGKNTVFYQAAAPTANKLGDLWIDTDDGNRIYVCTAVPNTWADARDTGIQQALDDAGGAQATADGKSKFSAGASPHSPAVVNDVWFNGDTTTNCPDSNCLGHTLDGSGVPNVGSYPHRKLFWVHRCSAAGSPGTWLDAKGQESIIAADITAGSMTAVAIAADSITVKHLTVLSDRDNLWPNPSSEISPPAGADTTQPEWADRYDTGSDTGGYSGRWVRQMSAAQLGTGFWLPCSPGARFYAEAQGRRTTGTGASGYVAVVFAPTLGSFTGATYYYSGYAASSSWDKISVTSSAAPAGTNAVYIAYGNSAPGVTVQFDALLARRIMQAETIASEVITGTPATGWTVMGQGIRRSGGLVVGWVFLQAGASATSFAPVFTLPAGAYPALSVYCTGTLYDVSAGVLAVARFTINTSGVCGCSSWANGTNGALVTVPAVGSGDQVIFEFAFPWI